MKKNKTLLIIGGIIIIVGIVFYTQQKFFHTSTQQASIVDGKIISGSFYGAKKTDIELIESKRFSTGVVLLKYLPAKSEKNIA